MCFACILTEDIMKGLLAQKPSFFFFFLTRVVSLIKDILSATQRVGCRSDPCTMYFLIDVSGHLSLQSFQC